MASPAGINLNDVAAQWRAERRIYPIYSALLRQFELGVEPCRELESPIDRAEPEVLARVAAWFDKMDENIKVWQLRQVLQTTDVATEENLRALLQRHLDKPKRTAEVRDKLDYLFVQYYSHCAPHDQVGAPIGFDHVADALHHLLGDVSPLVPPSCHGLDAILEDMNACASLSDLLGRKLLERAREVKNKAGEDYYKPSALVAFTRFNYLVRLGFFRLMHADLHAVRSALHVMESRGQSRCDCSSAGLSAHEPLTHLRQVCHDWKQPFRAAYSAGNNFKQLVAIREAVETAVKLPPPAEMPEPAAAEATDAVESAAAESAAPQTKAAGGSTAAQKTAAAAWTFNLPSVDACIVQLAENLIHASGKNAAVVSLVIGHTTLMLASWEVAAYVRGGDDVSNAMQRAVAARAILKIGIDRLQAGEKLDLKPAIAAAHSEAAQIQERIAEAKDAKNIDAAVNLAATAKRLLGLLAEAEKVQGQGQ